MPGLDAIFKAYDVRGTYPDQLNEDVARAVGTAFATFAAAPRIAVARDMRPSGVTLVAAFAEGARVTGTEVIDLGMGSTDFCYFASGHLDAPAAMSRPHTTPPSTTGSSSAWPAPSPWVKRAASATSWP